MASVIRIILMLVALIVVTLCLLPFQVFAAWRKRLWHKSLPMFWQGYASKILGFRVNSTGEMATYRPLLLVSNHSSWSDILVLGSLGQMSFVAKSEVKNWPVFGTLAYLQNTIFIERHSKSKAKAQAKAIADRLSQGDVMVLFPEGTTSDGNQIFPFKSSLFGAAKVALKDSPDDYVLVQPVSITYTKLHGIPMGRYHRSVAGWPGTMALLPHLKGVLFAGAIDVEVKFGEPHKVYKATNRKSLARAIEADVRSMHQGSLSGSLPQQMTQIPSQKH
jgi:lyso-ornithine lipid O-acyltransferase